MSRNTDVLIIGGGIAGTSIARVLSKFLPWPEIQLERILIRPTLEAWSGEQRIWQGSFLKLIGNTRIPIPIEKFLWDRVHPDLGVTLRVTQGVS